MKKISLFLLLMVATIIPSAVCKAETNDLDLIILQNPENELKKAVKRGYLEKLVRVIKLIESKQLDLKIFQDPDLLKRASKRENKNNRNSKKYNFLRGALWTTLVTTILFPAGATKEFFWEGSEIKSLPSYWPLMMKGTLLSLNLWFLRLTTEGKAMFVKNARLANQLVKKYHAKSLAS